MVCNIYLPENGIVGKKLVCGSMLLSVLNGKYSEANLAKMATVKLERLLTQLVWCTSEFGEQSGKNGIKCYRRPKWWPKDVGFKLPIKQLRRRTYSSLTWNRCLRRLVDDCSQFCNNQRTTPVKWRQEDTKENVENREKRKADKSSVSGVKTLIPQTSNGRILRNKVLSAINTNPVLFVRLYDILKTPVVVPPAVSKNDFLRGFALQSKSDNVRSEREAIVPNSLRLAHVPHVPFSSDYGRVIISREKQPIPKEVHLRKIERLEWYTNDSHYPASTSSVASYPVTYDSGKEGSFHTYKFPRRQFYQGDSTLRTVSFLKSLCKPVSVRLTRIDCRKTQIKTKSTTRLNGVIRDVKVLIPRMNLKKIKAKDNKREPMVMLRRLRPKN